MRGMSSILRIALYPDAPSPNEPWERGDGRPGRPIRNGRLTEFITVAMAD